MKIFKGILIAVLAIIVLVLVMALFIEKDFEVTRKITINQPDSLVWENVKYLQNQEEFTVWTKMDPDVIRTYSGLDGTVGAIAGWKSDHPDVGSGEQEIIKIDEGKQIDFELRFKEPMESTGHAYFALEAQATEQTKLVWGFKGSMDYPMNFMLIFWNMDEMLGEDLNQGLINLKNLLEK